MPSPRYACTRRGTPYRCTNDATICAAEANTKDVRSTSRLSTRGLDALDRVGLSQALREQGIPMRGRMLHGRDRSVTFQPYSADPHNVLLSVSRDGLNAMLLDAVDQRQIATRFGHRLVDIELRSSNAVFEVGRRGAARTIRRHDRSRRCLFGGAHPLATHRSLQLRAELPRARLQGAHDPGSAPMAATRWSPTRCTSGPAAAT